MKRIHLAEGVSFDLDAIAHAMAILAVRGAGKTYAGLKLVEEVFDAGVQVCVVDPVGACWGLRASADGKGPGLPIVILGGEHGDVPLEPSAGEVVAQFLVETRQSVVLDLSPFRKGAARDFMAQFGEDIYRLKHREEYRDPLLFMADEFDAFAPQKPYKGMERCLGAMEDIVRRGRFRGLFPVMLTQRSAVLNKDVFNQAEVLIALRTMGSQDIHAWNDWMEKQGGTPQQRDLLLGEIASLPTGTAWFWAPVLDLFKKGKIRQRETFDSSATPKIGMERVQQPKVLAPVDLEKLHERMAATIARVKQTDPKELQKEIAHLKAELMRKPQISVPQPLRVEVPILKESQLKRLEAVAKKWNESVGYLRAIGSSVEAAAREISGAVLGRADGVRSGNLIAGTTVGPQSPALRARPAPSALPGAIVSNPPSTEKLKAGARRMLAVLAARHPHPLTRPQIATLAKIAMTGGTFRTYFGNLQEAGLIVEDEAGIALTRAGETYAGAGRTMAAKDLAATWAKNLKSGERKMLQVLAHWYPIALSRAQLGTLAGIAMSGGTFRTYFGRLQANGLIAEDSTGVQITPDGIMVSGVNPAPPAVMRDVVREFNNVLKRGEREMLDVLLADWPKALTQETLGGRAKVSRTGGTFRTYLGRLRENLLVDTEGDIVRLSDITLRQGVPA